MFSSKLSLEESVTSEDGGSSGNEADSEGEESFEELREMMECFQPYMFKPEKDISCSSGEEDSFVDEETIEPPLDSRTRVGNLEWCKCGGKCLIESREIDCLCCQEVDALNSKFDNETIDCVTESVGFETLCTNKLVLTNILTGLHETQGDFLEKNCSNRSLRYAAYKQFIWWVFKNLGKGNRRVIPSCAVWKIRNLFPEPDGKYSLYSDGLKD